MHVLFDARLLHRPLSGLERVMKNLLRELARLPQISRLSVAVQRGTRLPPDFPDRARAVEVDCTEDLLAVLLATDPRERPDVYHLTHFPDRSPKDLWLPIAADASVVEVHDAILNRHPEYHHSRDWHAAYDAFVRQLVRSCDRLLVHSESVRGEVQRDLGGDPGIVDVAPLAVDPALAAPFGPDEVSARLQRLGVSGRYFVALGKDYPHKGHPTLFRAFAQTSGCSLVCAGSKGWHGKGESADELSSSLRIAARVRWLDHLSDEDVKALLQGAVALVYPSREEGFGLPPIEAMALGTPVLAAASMSIPEVCGEGAALFPTDDSDALARLMAEAATGGARLAAQIERGRKRAATFSWARCAQDTLRCYQNALACKSGKKKRTRPVLDEGLKSVMRTICSSPHHDGAQVQQWITRASHYEQHAYALAANRDDVLRQLEELRKVNGRDLGPPPLHVAERLAEPRPRWSLKRRIGKIKAALKKRLE